VRFDVTNSPFNSLLAFDMHTGYLRDVRLPHGGSSGLHSFLDRLFETLNISGSITYFFYFMSP
jgi:hypothetical protein